MGLFDVIDDIAQKQVTKTETGDNRIYGVVVGLVTNNYDKAMPGRVCVQIPTRDSEANVLKWARVAMPSSGKSWGHYFLPEVGDQVLVVFEQGNIEKPYVIGCIPKDSNAFLTGAVDEHNKYKKITTRHGSTITFTDESGEGADQGEKDKIQIITAQTGHRVELDNEHKRILLSDKEGKNKIQMDTEKGEITVLAEKKLTVMIGDSITLTMNGSNGTTELKTKKFKVDEADTIEMNANKQFKADAASIGVSGSSSVKISGGPVTVSGSPIKIG